MSTRDSSARRPIAALLLALLTGCQGWQPAITGPETLIPAERPASVRVTLSDGVTLTVKDPIMRNDSIVPNGAAGTAVAASDIRLFEVQRFSAKKTLVFIVGAVVLAATWTGAVIGGGPGSPEAPGDEVKLAPLSICTAFHVGASF